MAIMPANGNGRTRLLYWMLGIQTIALAGFGSWAKAQFEHLQAAQALTATEAVKTATDLERRSADWIPVIERTRTTAENSSIALAVLSSRIDALDRRLERLEKR